MIQLGKIAAIGVTFGDPGLFVAARIFNSFGPVTGWMAMSNYDGGSYAVDYTFASAGAYRVKKVVFTDGTFTARNLGYAEADDAVQVVDVASLVLDVMSSSHNTPGTIGGAIGSGGGGGGGSGGGGGTILGIVANSPVIGLVTPSLAIIGIVE